MSKKLYGDVLAREVDDRIAPFVASLAALDATTADDLVNGRVFTVTADQSQWQYVAASAAVAGTDVRVPTVIGVGNGRMIRVGSQAALGLARIHAAAADTTALAAIVAADRANGMEIVKLDDYTLWIFEGASAAAASDWVVVPGAGNGRWVRRMMSRADVLYPANLAAIKAIPAASRFDGLLVTKADDGTRWRFVAGSVLTTDGDQLLIIPTAGTGVWVRNDKTVELSFAVVFGTADAAVLYTVPVGFRLGLVSAYWNVSVSWTGGTNSAIGLSSSNGGLSTKGDVLGGAGGDLAATTLSTGAYAKGTVGAKMGKPGAVIIAGETIRFDRVVDAFTAGAASARVVVALLASP